MASFLTPVCARCSAIRTTLWHSNVLTVAEIHPSYNKKCSFYKREYDIQHIRVSNNVLFFEARNIYQQSHGKKGDELCCSSQDSGPKHIDLQSYRLCHGSGLSLLLESSILLHLLLAD